MEENFIPLANTYSSLGENSQSPSRFPTNNNFLLGKKPDLNFKRTSVYNIKSVANLAGKLDSLQGGASGGKRFSTIGNRPSLSRKSIMKPSIIADAKARIHQTEEDIKKKIIMSFEAEENPMMAFEKFMTGMVTKKIDHIAIMAKAQEEEFLQRMYEKEQDDMKKEQERLKEEELRKKAMTSTGNLMLKRSELTKTFTGEIKKDGESDEEIDRETENNKNKIDEVVKKTRKRYHLEKFDKSKRFYKNQMQTFSRLDTFINAKDFIEEINPLKVKKKSESHEKLRALNAVKRVQKESVNFFKQKMDEIKNRLQKQREKRAEDEEYDDEFYDEMDLDEEDNDVEIGVNPMLINNEELKKQQSFSSSGSEPSTPTSPVSPKMLKIETTGHHHKSSFKGTKLNDTVTKSRKSKSNKKIGFFLPGDSVKNPEGSRRGSLKGDQQSRGSIKIDERRNSRNIMDSRSSLEMNSVEIAEARRNSSRNITISNEGRKGSILNESRRRSSLTIPSMRDSRNSSSNLESQSQITQADKKPKGKSILKSNVNIQGLRRESPVVNMFEGRKKLSFKDVVSSNIPEEEIAKNEAIFSKILGRHSQKVMEETYYGKGLIRKRKLRKSDEDRLRLKIIRHLGKSENEDALYGDIENGNFFDILLEHLEKERKERPRPAQTNVQAIEAIGKLEKYVQDVIQKVTKKKTEDGGESLKVLEEFNKKSQNVLRMVHQASKKIYNKKNEMIFDKKIGHKKTNSVPDDKFGRTQDTTSPERITAPQKGNHMRQKSNPSFFLTTSDSGFKKDIHNIMPYSTKAKLMDISNDRFKSFTDRVPEKIDFPPLNQPYKLNKADSLYQSDQFSSFKTSTGSSLFNTMNSIRNENRELTRNLKYQANKKIAGLIEDLKVMSEEFVETKSNFYKLEENTKKNNEKIVGSTEMRLDSLVMTFEKPASMLKPVKIKKKKGFFLSKF